jgi:hypothetical protein
MLSKPQQESWSKYFNSINELNNHINEAMNKLLDVSIPSDDQISKLDQISKDKGDSMILFYCSATKSMKLIHSIVDIGRTTWFRDPLLVALDGFKNKTATPLLIDQSSILEVIEIDTPITNRLTVITNKDDLPTTKVPENNPQKFKTLPFIMVPPFLWDLMANIKDKSPKNVFIKALKTIDSFIDNNKEDDSLKQISKNSCTRLLTFLWAAEKSLLKSIHFLPSGDDAQVIEWCRQRHSICIKNEEEAPSTRDLEWERLSEAIESSRTAISEKISESSKDSTEKKGFSKLDKSVCKQIP